MAENLWALREQKKISVATLASRAGLPIGLILEYESGQRGVEPKHLARLARALYVEESDIRLQSDPRPGAPQREPRGRAQGSDGVSVSIRSEEASGSAASADTRSASPVEGSPARPRERGARPMRSLASRPPVPPRPSQLAQLNDLLSRAGRTEAELEAKLQRPIAALDRIALSAVLKELQTELREGLSVERRRGYLPETVDSFEFNYLERARATGAVLEFSLFDGTNVAGSLIGFSPYSMTVRQSDGADITLNKLAIAWYRATPSGHPPEAAA